ncbi:hypothetical protein U8C35_04240 [Sinorhizobium medicae]|uniref:hypothetical protein n=1 Tax=Sinorhizobium medicae TaxID=110321 RepID=UPI002AF6C9C0|nr:hypothetical protein [Sinorhizobium medicae]WQO59670.1 hypothetical protein U8C35_04240 [Sinorhizobium medicae]
MASRFFGIAIALLQVSNAAAQPTDGPKFEETGKYAGKYFCAPIAAGGVYWDKTTKEWRGTSFRVSEGEQFVFQTTVGDRMQWEAAGFSVAGIPYYANVLPLGGSGVACWGARAAYHPAHLVGHNHIFMSQDGSFHCGTYGGLYHYAFDLTSGRYMATYYAGFIDGDDSGRNAPSIQIGKCTRIE